VVQHGRVKFVSALFWIVLGLCLGTVLSRANRGPHLAAGHAYAQHHAEADATVATKAFAAEIDGSASNQE
jgi:hypothetical protein